MGKIFGKNCKCQQKWPVLGVQNFIICAEVQWDKMITVMDDVILCLNLSCTEDKFAASLCYLTGESVEDFIHHQQD